MCSLTGCLNGPTKTCLPVGRLPSGSYCPSASSSFPSRLQCERLQRRLIADHVVTSCPGTGVKACDAAGKATACKADYHLTDDAQCVQW